MPIAFVKPLLSDLIIDTDKSWASKDITSVDDLSATTISIGADTQLYRSAANVLSLAAGDSLAFGGTVAINSSRDLTVGTIGCGAITSTGAVQGTSYNVGATNIIDTSRNLVNIGTIGCGAITSTSTVLGTSVLSTTRPSIGACAIASDTVQYAKDGYVESSSATYISFRSFKLFTTLSSYKVKATLRVNANTGYAQVFVNGVAVGAEISVSSTYTLLDLGTFYKAVPGDIIEIYCRRGTGNWVYGTTFGVYFTVTTTTTEFV